jgi:Flp pilus assembly protein TadD
VAARGARPLADALIQLGKPQDGLVILSKLRADAIPKWQEDLLRGKASAASGKWADARSQLARAIKAKPDLPEAHYLLGKAYEQSKDWENAAREYRIYSELKRSR